MVRTIHYCPLCDYKTDRKNDRDRHIQKKHQSVQNHTGSGVLQNGHQTSGQPQNVYQSQEVNACMSQWQEAYQNMDARYKQSEKEKAEIIQYCNAQSSRAPTTVSVGPDCPKAPTTVSVPPFGSTDQYGYGVEGFTRRHFNRIVKVDEKGNHHEQTASNNQNYIQIKNLNILSRSDNIEYLLNHRKEFLGCFPSDKLPEFPTEFPKSMIINTDETNQPGDHWVALVLTKDKCYYFDSMGMPILEENIMNYIEPHYNDIKYSNSRIQDLKSNKCGAFCVCFVLFVTNDKTFRNFLKLFSKKNLSSNDENLKELFQDIIFIENF